MDRCIITPTVFKLPKLALVCGAGGFIGSHMVHRLKSEGYLVHGIDLKHPEFLPTVADNFTIGDLRNVNTCKDLFLSENYDEIYQFAADMGGAGFVFTGANDSEIIHNNALINLNIAKAATKLKRTKIFYSSSACIYPEYNQQDSEHPVCREDSAYPANPDSEYGWEKLFSERVYLTFHRNLGLNVRIARYHNIFGPNGTYDGGREKAPAAICRKVALAKDIDEIEIWGDGLQTRSFLYIDECIEATRRLMDSDFIGPVNIGSEEMVSINQLTDMVIKISGKNLKIRHVDGPLGVRGRNSDNKLYKERIGWCVDKSLYDGLKKTYDWILWRLAMNQRQVIEDCR